MPCGYIFNNITYCYIPSHNEPTSISNLEIFDRKSKPKSSTLLQVIAPGFSNIAANSTEETKKYIELKQVRVGPPEIMEEIFSSANSPVRERSSSPSESSEEEIKLPSSDKDIRKVSKHLIDPRKIHQIKRNGYFKYHTGIEQEKILPKTEEISVKESEALDEKSRIFSTWV